MYRIEIGHDETDFSLSATVEEKEGGQFQIDYVLDDGEVVTTSTIEFTTNKSMTSLDIAEMVITSVRWNDE